MCSRNCGLLSRSGLISSRSTVPVASRSRTSSHSSRLVLLIVCARSPSRSRGGDLVAHQRQQRTDDQRRSRAGLAQQRGRDEVHGRLSPPGALHAQHAGAIRDEILNRLELPRPKPRAIVGRQRTQALERRRGERLRGSGGGHTSIVARRPEDLSARSVASDRGAPENRLLPARAASRAALRAGTPPRSHPSPRRPGAAAGRSRRCRASAGSGSHPAAA